MLVFFLSINRLLGKYLQMVPWTEGLPRDPQGCAFQGSAVLLVPSCLCACLVSRQDWLGLAIEPEPRSGHGSSHS